MIFVPNFLDCSMPRTPYVYVQPFRILPRLKGKPDPDTNMYTFVRVHERDGTRKGQVFPLNRVWQQVELLPKHSGKCDQMWTCDTAVELAGELSLNNYRNFIELY